MKEINNYSDDHKYMDIDDVKIFLDFINSRIKILKFDNISAVTLQKIKDLAIKYKLGKIICCIKGEWNTLFIASGFRLEGMIDGFFKGIDGFYYSYFIDENRNKIKELINKVEISKKIFNMDMEKKNVCNLDYEIRTATKKDIVEIINVFKTVFSSYPTPIYSEKFIEDTMAKDILYKVAIHNNKIISIASADMDNNNLNAEITDCATLPEYRGKGLTYKIIESLEEDLKKIGFITLYSLSRAINPSINTILIRSKYKFRGILINNCHICGGYEDMNIWVKQIL